MDFSRFRYADDLCFLKSFWQYLCAHDVVEIEKPFLCFGPKVFYKFRVNIIESCGFWHSVAFIASVSSCFSMRFIIGKVCCRVKRKDFGFDRTCLLCFFLIIGFERCLKRHEILSGVGLFICIDRSVLPVFNLRKKFHAVRLLCVKFKFSRVSRHLVDLALFSDSNSCSPISGSLVCWYTSYKFSHFFVQQGIYDFVTPLGICFLAAPTIKLTPNA